MNINIIIKEAGKYYGKTEVLRDISLEVNNDKPLVLCGPSGCGKSILLKLIAGLESLDKGEIYIKDRLVGTKNFSLEPHRRKVGFVFQSAALWPHLTVKDNILYGVKALGKSEKDQFVDELLKQFEISDLAERYPGEISGGQARRVSIARALAVKPEVLLLDEPLTNLENDLKIRLIDILSQYIKRQKPCTILVTHQMEEAPMMGGKILKMKDGMFV